jgi:hypothetical protein
LEQPLDVTPSNDHPARATGVPVAIVVGLHVAISTAIIARVDPDVPELLPYWVASVLVPSLVWAVLVIGRAAVWKQPSAFWLAFIRALGLFLGNARLGDISARGVPLALVYSSWVLLACAVLVAIVLRMLGKHADAPIDAAAEAPLPLPAGDDGIPAAADGDRPDAGVGLADSEGAPAEQSRADSR